MKTREQIEARADQQVELALVEEEQGEFQNAERYWTFADALEWVLEDEK